MIGCYDILAMRSSTEKDWGSFSMADTNASLFRLQKSRPFFKSRCPVAEN
jgi:hypothetical protein